MFEAVGERWWPAYFERIAACLPRGGRAMVQTIVIDDALFEQYRRGSDFIRQFIFPGGMLASNERFRRLARGAGLEVAEAFRFGGDYALTLAAWREHIWASGLHETLKDGDWFDLTLDFGDKGKLPVKVRVETTPGH